jgi:hypothetical protein
MASKFIEDPRSPSPTERSSSPNQRGHEKLTSPKAVAPFNSQLPPKYQKYYNMQIMSFPEDLVIRRMRTDGISPIEIARFFQLSKPHSVITNTDNNNETRQFAIVKQGTFIDMDTITSTKDKSVTEQTNSIIAPSESTPQTQNESNTSTERRKSTPNLELLRKSIRLSTETKIAAEDPDKTPSPKEAARRSARTKAIEAILARKGELSPTAESPKLSPRPSSGTGTITEVIIVTTTSTIANDQSLRPRSLSVIAEERESEIERSSVVTQAAPFKTYIAERLSGVDENETEADIEEQNYNSSYKNGKNENTNTAILRNGEIKNMTNRENGTVQNGRVHLSVSPNAHKPMEFAPTSPKYSNKATTAALALPPARLKSSISLNSMSSTSLKATPPDLDMRSQSANAMNANATPTNARVRGSTSNRLSRSKSDEAEELWTRTQREERRTDHLLRMGASFVRNESLRLSHSTPAAGQSPSTKTVTRGSSSGRESLSSSFKTTPTTDDGRTPESGGRSPSKKRVLGTSGDNRSPSTPVSRSSSRKLERTSSSSSSLGLGSRLLQAAGLSWLARSP